MSSGDDERLSRATTMGRRSVLGRGLSALIPGGDADLDPIDPRSLSVDFLVPAHVQPRTRFDETRLRELADSIRANGVIQPIVVRRLGPQAYQIIAGERRWRAARLAGLREVPVVVRDVTNAVAFELALIENVQREDLNPLEEAAAYKYLIDAHQFSHAQLAARLGKDRATISNCLRLLKLAPAVRELVAAELLTAGHARALMTLEEGPTQEKLAIEAVRNGWSVRETERQARLVREAEAPDASPERAPRVSATTEAISERLSKAVGAPIRLVERNGRGRIEIRFRTNEELERLVELIGDLGSDDG